MAAMSSDAELQLLAAIGGIMDSMTKPIHDVTQQFREFNAQMEVVREQLDIIEARNNPPIIEEEPY